MNAYKLLDVETRGILISRDVVFHEEVFRFHYSTYKNQFNPFQSKVIPCTQNDIFDDEVSQFRSSIPCPTVDLNDGVLIPETHANYTRPTRIRKIVHQT